VEPKRDTQNKRREVIDDIKKKIDDIKNSVNARGGEYGRVTEEREAAARGVKGDRDAITHPH
jgi:hypothetical protein